MEVGTTVTWREAVTANNNGRRVVVGERVVTGMIIELGHTKTGGQTCKVTISHVEGEGAEIVSRSIWIKRTKILKGKSWQRSRIRRSAGGKRPGWK